MSKQQRDMSAEEENPPNQEDRIRFPIVGIGASAGGFDALRRLLEAMPPQPNVALVVVQHLARDKPSLASELLAKYTTMEVRQVRDEPTVKPNCVYIIPPGKYLGIVDGRLKLLSMKGPRCAPVAIDYFFRALSKDQRQRAIGVILSGTGSDGTLGIKAIKEAGGFVIAQEPSTAEYDGMPQSAIATGLVDQILTPEKIPEAIIQFAKHSYFCDPAAPGTESESIAAIAEDDAADRDVSADGLEAVLALLHQHGNRDFRNYKRATLLRRTQRRMCLHHLDRLADYLDFLREHPAEIESLAKDLLISVTDFFRDGEAWEALAAQVIPNIVNAKKAIPSDTNGVEKSVRVWVPGCATGEEAYTIAMLFLDELSEQHLSCKLQIFASDVDTSALQYARAGRYPISVEADISHERLQRYFSLCDGEMHYQVNKLLRDTVVFADHNLIADPPFSQLDLVCCRNVLIYLQPDMQQKVISLFHFALHPQGYLMLGTAETVGRQDELFETINKRWRIFRAVATKQPERVDIPTSTGTRRHEIEIIAPPPRRAVRMAAKAQKKLLDMVAPSAVLVDRDLQILYVSGDVNAYLRIGSGVPSDDLLTNLPSGLRSRVRSVVQQAFTKREGLIVNCPLDSTTGSAEVLIEVRVIQDGEQADDCALVVFHGPAEPRAPIVNENPEASVEMKALNESEVSDEAVIRQLEEELAAVKDDLQATVEQFEGSHEEYMASNEEVMSVNEELQSTNEELETSKEELQSLNEELATVNQQLASKVEELENKHSDLENLIAATELATICLGTDMTIRWFTPAVQSLVPIVAADRGRPLANFVTDFTDGNLLDECAQVLKRLLPIENEVQCNDGRSFIRRSVPYRTDEYQIGGVVITMLDITSRKRREEALRASEERFRRSLSIDGIGVLFFDAQKTLIDCNDWFLAVIGYTREDVQSRSLTVASMTPPQWGDVTAQQFDRVKHCGRLGPFEKEYFRKDGSRISVMLSGCSLENGTIVVHCIDIGERKRIETELRKTQEKLSGAATAARLGWYSLDVQKNELIWSDELRALAQIGPNEPMTLDRERDLMIPEDRDRYRNYIEQVLRDCCEDGYRGEFRMLRGDGSVRWIEDRGKFVSVQDDGSTESQMAIGMVMDITERKEAELQLAEWNATLEQQVSQRTKLLAMLQRITRASNEAKTVDEAMKVAIEQISNYNGWVIGHVWRLAADDSGQMESSRLWYVCERALASLPQFDHFRKVLEQTRLSSGQGLVGEVMKSATPKWVDDIAGFHEASQFPDLGLHAAIAFPVMVEHKVVAVLEFLSDKVIKPEEKLLEMVPDIGIQLGHVIARKRLDKLFAEITIAEQKRIGRELHDGIAQQLTGGALIAESLKRSLPPEATNLHEGVNHLREILRQTHRDVRQLSSGLLLMEIEAPDLLPTLQGLAAETTSRHQLLCEVKHNRFDESFINDDGVAFIIYQIVRESVHNAVKHANSTRITIELASGEHFQLAVCDNGTGITEAARQRENCNGLRIMRYRAQSVGGELEIQSGADSGTCTRLTIPKKSCQK